MSEVVIAQNDAHPSETSDDVDVESADEPYPEVSLIEPQLAGLRSRLIASVIDTWCPLALVVGSVALLGVGGSVGKILSYCAFTVAATFFVGNSFVLQGRRGAGVGKAAADCALAREENRTSSLGRQILWRNLLHIADIVTVWGWIRPWRQVRRQTFADSLGGSVVVVGSDRTRLGESDRESRRRRSLAVVTGVITAALLVGGVGVGYLQSYRPDKEAGNAEDSIGKIASEGVRAVLSYESATATQDTTEAQKYLGGDFLKYFRDFTAQVVVPAAQDKGITMKAEVVGAGVISAESQDASVVVFVNQLASSDDGNPPTTTQSAIKVALEKAGDTWRIVEFEPVV